MGLSNREQQVWDEIKQWEQQLLHNYEQHYEIHMYKIWLEKAINLLPSNSKKEFFSKLDNWLFHFHAVIQDTQLHNDSRQRILTLARIFDENIQQINQLKDLSIDQLKYISENQIVKYRLVSMVQGGLTGTGHSLFITTDLLGIAVLNLRVVQLIALSYGFDSKTPFEMMVSLKVFYYATLPKRFQKLGWDLLLDELKHEEQSYFYEGNENVIDEKWVEQLIKQMIKTLFLLQAKQKMTHLVPIVGVTLGVGMNYNLTRNVSQFAEKYYQLRLLVERKEKDEYTRA